MIYIKAFWFHDDIDYPVEMYSELDDARYEIKKIEFFLNQKVGYATENYAKNNTRLGICPVPSLDEINQDPQFKVEEISKDDFYAIWHQYIIS